MASQEIRELTRALPFERNGFNSDNVDVAGGMDVVVMRWLASAGQLAPAYWSRYRDTWLRQFYLKSDHLKIATATFVQKAYTIPLTIAARDRNVKAHVALAEQIHADVMRNSGILKGFLPEFAKFATDYTTQDNGAFMLVMGGGKADGPITGSVVGLMHLDSARCTRTGHPEYPVIYDHVDNKRYKLHYTRIIFLSSMPSADAEMYDVGLCAISRCMDSAQDMVDIAAYNSEKLGSRPARQILYVKTGATLKQLQDAVLLANTKMDAQGLERFSRTMQMAPASPTGTLELATVDLTSVPDGFDREKATMLDIAVIAAAYGMDARDLAHSFGLSGQTKADAEVQHLKTRGKGIEQFLSDFAEQLNQKVLPETLEAWFDYVDDTQDSQAATIRKTRAEGRQIDLTSGAVSMRVAREQMLENDEITQAQFDDMELAEGRLSDGLDVLMLFQSQDGEIVKVLGGLVENPLDIEADESLLPAINERMTLAWQRHDAAPNANIKRKMRQAMAALEKLRTLVKPPPTPTEPETVSAEDDEDEGEEDSLRNEAPEPTEDVETKEAIIPNGRTIPALPDGDEIADEAEENADEALRSWDEVHPDYAGLLDAAIGKKKEIKASTRFSYDDRAFRFRDDKTGRFVSEQTVKTLASQYENARREIGGNLAKQLANKDITLQQWVSQMRSELRNTYSAEYMLGRGGRNAMTATDWGRVGNLLKGQYGYLDVFAKEIAAGKLSEAQIAVRSGMYFKSATQAYERAKTIGARGMPELPAYPGDGSTPCRSNCKCSWSIKETKTAWLCTWQMSDAEHCSGCLDRAGQWSPLTVPKEQ